MDKVTHTYTNTNFKKRKYEKKVNIFAIKSKTSHY